MRPRHALSFRRFVNGMHYASASKTHARACPLDHLYTAWLVRPPIGNRRPIVPWWRPIVRWRPKVPECLGAVVIQEELLVAKSESLFWGLGNPKIQGWIHFFMPNERAGFLASNSPLVPASWTPTSSARGAALAPTALLVSLGVCLLARASIVSPLRRPLACRSFDFAA